LHLLEQGLTRKTLNLHRDNLWALGGELIRDLHETPKLRKRPAIEWVVAAVDGGEGPVLHWSRDRTRTAFLRLDLQKALSIPDATLTGRAGPNAMTIREHAARPCLTP